MTSHVLIIGDGVLADTVCGLLDANKLYAVDRQSEVPTEVREDVDLALVLDDAWHPSVHLAAEMTFRNAGVPWLRAFAAFGNGMVGPLVRAGSGGCSYCADVRTVMAEADRAEMVRLRMDMAADSTPRRDVWATRTGLLHVARLLVREVEQIFSDVETCLVADHVLCVNLKTLRTTRHFILPVSGCPVCTSLSEDSPEAAVIHLDATAKFNENSYRGKSIAGMAATLAHDYLDYAAGLLNGKVHDLITPFAQVSVNLPLLMGDEGASGRSHAYDECESIAILEGIERYCGLEPRAKRPAVTDAYANVSDHALNPVTVGLHDPGQYARPDFPFRPFDQNAAIDWVWGYSLTEKRPLLVPKRLAYYSLGCHDGFVYETSNGCAVGGTLVDAIFHGILEIVERDAFLMTWYARLPLPAIDLSCSTDRELQWMIERLRAVAGYDLHVYNATMENEIPTVFVIATNRRSHGLHLLCSAGAHVNPMRAIKGAIHETAGMLLRLDDKVETERETLLQMLADSTRVERMEDHSMLYGLPEAAERLQFLLDDGRSKQTLDQAFSARAKHLDLRDDLTELVDVFRRLNLNVLVVNQTAPELARNGLHCVKVIIPGMLPMTFGHHLTRLEHLPRVLTVPVKLGYAKKPLTREDLNPFPHPFP